MRIVFDMAYDQSVAPNGVAVGSASIGKVFVGPNGLLNLLETALGLGGKEIHQAIRIQQYMECMEGLIQQQAFSFCADSFDADPWSSAKQMLAWRDELVLAGWGGGSHDAFTPRLAALALIEQALPDTLRCSTGDRLAVVLQALKQQRQLTISQMDLMEQIETLPRLLQQLMHALRECGINVHENLATDVPTASKSNLYKVKEAMLANAERINASAGDDSLLLLTAEDEWSAANTVANWLKADEAANRDLLLIQGQGSDVLDAALKRVGLPVQGINRRSPWRAALQVLPLALANVWKPFNVHALLEFLSLPVSPVPTFAAQALRGAIQREPGIGGERWCKAEAKIIAIRKSRQIKGGMNDDEAEADAQQFMAEIRTNLTELRFDPREGIPPQALIDLCSWVKGGLKSPRLKQSMAQALAQVDRLMELASRHHAPIPRAQIERMLDSVIAEGGQNPDAVAEASPWMRVSDPGAIADSVETIVWWGFTDSGQSPITFWSREERQTLAAIDVYPEHSTAIRQREARQGRNALRFAGKRLLLVAPKQVNGTAVPLHPLWDEIRHFAVSAEVNDPESIYQQITVRADSLNTDTAVVFAGRTLQWKVSETTTLPKAETVVQVDVNSITRPEKLSFSQMSTLIGCPTKWAMQYHAGLESMDSLGLPTGNTMIGSLCHKVVEELYRQPALWNATTLRSRAAELFDGLVPQMAAELLEPGRELERQRYRHSTCDAVEALIAAIDAAGLTVVKTEAWVDGKQLKGVDFGGYIDLLLEDNEGTPFVIDLKWSGSSKYKREEIEKGKALQLASYAWLLRKADKGVWAAGAYFMLAQGELLTADDRFHAYHTLESPSDVKAIWQRGSQTWLHLLDQAKQGAVEVSGLLDEEELKADREEHDLMYIQPPCHFCDFGKLCGTARAEA